MRFDQAVKRTHEYKRLGTTTLFAGLCWRSPLEKSPRTPVASGTATGVPGLLQAGRQSPHPWVKLHVVAEKYSTHNYPNVKARLAKNPRVTVHFTPTGASWMNMVGIFFGIIIC